MGRGGGQVVIVLAFYSDDPSLNPAEAYSFFCKIVFEKNEKNKKRGLGWPTLNKERYAWDGALKIFCGIGP